MALFDWLARNIVPSDQRQLKGEDMKHTSATPTRRTTQYRRAIPGFAEIAFALGTAALLAGCGDSGSAPSDSQTESTPEALRAAVSSALWARGVNFTDLRIDAEARQAIADHDMVFSLDALLAPAGGALDEASLLHPEGYSMLCGISGHGLGHICGAPPAATNVTLKLSPGLTPGWRTAFLEAAGQWSDAACIQLVTTGGSVLESITVQIANLSDPNAIANSKFPLGKACGAHCSYFGVGDTINVSPDFEFFSAAEKRNVALHELGHTLGFVHPEDPAAAGGVAMFDYIPGTASSTGYSTVMHALISFPFIDFLTPDDIRSRDFFFGGPTCQVSPP